MKKHEQTFINIIKGITAYHIGGLQNAIYDGDMTKEEVEAKLTMSRLTGAVNQELEYQRRDGFFESPTTSEGIEAKHVNFLGTERINEIIEAAINEEMKSQGYDITEEETKMTKSIKELAMERVHYWVSEEFNRGWTINENDGQKLRMKKEQHAELIATQEKLMAEIEAELINEEGAAAEVEAEANVIDVSNEAVEEVPTIHNPEFLGTSGTTDRLVEHVQTAKVQPKLVTISCASCGAPRVIKVQDKFQVKFCKDCQRKHRNERRRELRKAKKLEAQG